MSQVPFSINITTDTTVQQILDGLTCKIREELLAVKEALPPDFRGNPDQSADAAVRSYVVWAEGEINRLKRVSTEKIERIEQELSRLKNDRTSRYNKANDAIPDEFRHLQLDVAVEEMAKRITFLQNMPENSKAQTNTTVDDHRHRPPLSISKDGNQFLCLYGDDPQSGIAGFGFSESDAVTAFVREWARNHPGDFKEKTPAPSPAQVTKTYDRNERAWELFKARYKGEPADYIASMVNASIQGAAMFDEVSKAYVPRFCSKCSVMEYTEEKIIDGMHSCGTMLI